MGILFLLVYQDAKGRVLIVDSYIHEGIAQTCGREKMAKIRLVGKDGFYKEMVVQSVSHTFALPVIPKVLLTASGTVPKLPEIETRVFDLCDTEAIYIYHERRK